MTVGIAAISEAQSDNPKVVVAADRLVTSGRAAPREYEHTSSKMLDICGSNGNEQCVAVGVGAGSVSLADEVFYKIKQASDDDSPSQVRDIAHSGVESLQEVVQETINRQVLSPHQLDLTQFNKLQAQMNPNIVQALYQEIDDKKNEVLHQVNLMLAGVDESGAHLYNIVQNDMARNDSIGYMTIGSGAEPARSAFIRNRYDDGCDLSEALLSVVEAKAQAEDAQGVGERMDITVLSGNGRRDLNDDELDELRSVYDDVIEAEKDARNDTKQENSYAFSL